MILIQQIVAACLRGLTGLIFRVDDEQLARIPQKGPLIIVSNHVHILEIPTLYTRLLPRPAKGMVLASRWDNPVFRWILELFGTIPICRGEADLSALRKGLDALAAGNILIVDPEGTRSGDGCLQRGRAGAILLALRSGVPILPVVHYGSENYKENLRHLHRTGFHFRIGRQFHIKADETKKTHAVRQQIIDEVMYQMAALLPATYRGAYTHMDAATANYLTFLA